MSLTLYYHPLSSFCWKVLIALYEAEVSFAAKIVKLGDPQDRATFAQVWPLAKFPVLRDEARGETVPETTIIIDYIARHYPSAASLIPTDSGRARRARLLDRLFDNDINLPLQQWVSERLRPGRQCYPFGAEQARTALRRGYDLLAPMIDGPWAIGETFTLADCAALPALFYADYALPLQERPTLAAYLDRLKTRPSVSRVLKEAEPFMQYSHS